VAHAFANGARELIVAPRTGAGFRVGGDIRRKDLTAQTLQQVHVLAGAERAGHHGRIVALAGASAIKWSKGSTSER